MVNQVRQIIAELDNFTEFRIRQLTAEVTSLLIETTPVDTGWARANWVPNFSSPSVDRRELSREEQASELPSAQARQQGGIARVVAGYTLARGEVFISNGVPYITRLNDGSSRQAPAMFVQTAIRRAVAKVART